MSQITKAVLACGGWSTRFLPAVKSYAKQMVPILDKPQIHHLLAEMAGAGITDIAIIHRPGETSIEKYFTSDPELDNYLKQTGKETSMESWHQLISRINSIKFFAQTNDFPYGNGTPILVAKDFIGEDPFVYAFGDDLRLEITPGTFLTSMIKTFQDNTADAVIAVQEVPLQQSYRYGMMKFASDPKVANQIIDVIEKPQPETSPSSFAQVSPFIFSSKLIQILLNQSTGKGNELWLTDALHTLAQTNLVLSQTTPDNCWTTTGDPLNWLKANITMALIDERYKDDIKSYLQNLSY